MQNPEPNTIPQVQGQLPNTETNPENPDTTGQDPTNPTGEQEEPDKVLNEKEQDFQLNVDDYIRQK